jgi:hypothetical protein
MVLLIIRGWYQPSISHVLIAKVTIKIISEVNRRAPEEMLLLMETSSNSIILVQAFGNLLNQFHYIFDALTDSSIAHRV